MSATPTIVPPPPPPPSSARKMSLPGVAFSPTSTSSLPPPSTHHHTAAELFALVRQFDPNTITTTNQHDINNSRVYALEVQLRTLKALGRDPEVSSLITTDFAVDLIQKFILNNISKRVTHEALTFIANGLVLNSAFLAAFDPLPVFDLVLTEYAKPGLLLKENYLLGRLLFLFTFNGPDLSQKQLAACIDLVQFKTSVMLENVHALTSVVAINNLLRLSFIELMKFVFNLMHHYPDQVTEPLQQTAIPNLSCIFLSIDTSDLLNVDITRYLLHTLMCVSAESWFHVPFHQPLLLRNMINYCQLVTSPKNTHLHKEQTLSPALTCLQQVVTYIWETQLTDLKLIVRQGLYPTEADRQLALGNSDSLASNFLNLASDITVQSCNRIVQETYLVVFDRNQQQLTETMGFGFGCGLISAAGAGAFLDDTGASSPPSLLMDTPRTRHNSVVDQNIFPNGPTAALFSDSRRGSTVSSDSSVQTPSAHPAVNPITGQYLDAVATNTGAATTAGANEDQRRQEWAALSDHEKEAESERMFMLLDRLKHGSIGVGAGVKPGTGTVPIPN